MPPSTALPCCPVAPCAASAAIMQIMIAQLCGVTDVHLLFALFGLMGSCMLFGWCVGGRGERWGPARAWLHAPCRSRVRPLTRRPPLAVSVAPSAPAGRWSCSTASGSSALPTTPPPTPGSRPPRAPPPCPSSSTLALPTARRWPPARPPRAPALARSTGRRSGSGAIRSPWPCCFRRAFSFS